MLVAVKSIFQIIGTANVRRRVSAIKKVDIIHRLSPLTLVLGGLRLAVAELQRGEGGDGGTRTHASLTAQRFSEPSQWPLCDVSKTSSISYAADTLSVSSPCLAGR